jgi:hypothetical protein
MLAADGVRFNLCVIKTRAPTAVVSFAAYPTSKWRQKLAHAALHVLAFAFMLLGLIFVFRFHADKYNSVAASTRSCWA